MEEFESEAPARPSTPELDIKPWEVTFKTADQFLKEEGPQIPTLSSISDCSPTEIINRCFGTKLNVKYPNYEDLRYSFKVTPFDLVDAIKDVNSSRSSHSYKEVVKRQEDVSRDPNTPKFNSIWQHYKGGRYVVVGLSISEKNEEHNVLYFPIPMVLGMLYPWSKPLSKWHKEKEWEGQKVKRFIPAPPPVL